MPKRISIVFLCTVMIAIFALFSTKEVRAFSDYCGPPEETLVNNGWQIKLVEVEPCTISSSCDGDGLYDWYYEVKNISTGTSSGLNFLAMLIPDCCTDPEITVYIDQGTLFNDYFDVAEGEPTVRFGMYNEQARVAKGTADKQIDWHLITNTNVKTSSTILLSVKKLGALTFEMAVPGCSGFGEYTPTATEEVRTIKSTKFKILRAPGTGCGIGLQIWNGTIFVDVDPADPPTVPDPENPGQYVSVADCGGTKGKSGCLQECIFTAAASPGWTYINLGGTWYKVYIP